MQRLVAEAAKDAPGANGDGGSSGGAANPAIGDEAGEIDDRLANIENLLAAGFEKLARAPAVAPESGVVPAQLRKIDEHLTALRNTESVNHRLFNTLHQELKTYRDNFMRDSLQKPFIRDLIILHDDLSSLSGQMQNAGSSGDATPAKVSQWSENLENTLHSLIEILHRLEVKEIKPAETVDLTLHRVVSYEPADFAEEDGRIIMRLRRGFRWRDQVLRPEEVVAKRFG